MEIILNGVTVHIIGSKRSRRFKNPKNEPPVRPLGKEPHSITMSVQTHIFHIRTRFFPKKVRVRFFDRNFCERTIRNGKQERTKTWYHQAGNMPSALFGAFWVNRCVSEACISLAITHQTLCQGAQPTLKFLRSVYAHKQPNDQDLLYNVFFHWKVWYTRLNKMGFVEVVTWIGQKS